jgi:hypothetical protein
VWLVCTDRYRAVQWWMVPVAQVVSIVSPTAGKLEINCYIDADFGGRRGSWQTISTRRQTFVTFCVAATKKASMPLPLMRFDSKGYRKHLYSPCWTRWGWLTRTKGGWLLQIPANPWLQIPRHLKASEFPSSRAQSDDHGSWRRAWAMLPLWTEPPIILVR